MLFALEGALVAPLVLRPSEPSADVRGTRPHTVSELAHHPPGDHCGHPWEEWLVAGPGSDGGLSLHVRSFLVTGQLNRGSLSKSSSGISGIAKNLSSILITMQ